MLFVFVEVMYFVYKHLQTKPEKFNKLNTKVTFQILKKASLSLEKKETRGLDITSLLSKCFVFLIYCFSHVYGHLRIRAPRGYPRIVGECKKNKKSPMKNKQKKRVTPESPTLFFIYRRLTYAPTLNLMASSIVKSSVPHR